MVWSPCRDGRGSFQVRGVSGAISLEIASALLGFSMRGVMMSFETESCDGGGRSRAWGARARRGARDLFRAPLAGASLAAIIAFLALSVPFIGGRRAAQAAPAGTVHYPDLQSVVPLTGFFIENPSPTTRLLSYTHIIPNIGDGPFEIRPAYDPTTDTARGFQ